MLRLGAFLSKRKLSRNSCDTLRCSESDRMERGSLSVSYEVVKVEGKQQLSSGNVFCDGLCIELDVNMGKEKIFCVDFTSNIFYTVAGRGNRHASTLCVPFARILVSCLPLTHLSHSLLLIISLHQIFTPTHSPT